jgi:hypothetical protein
LANDRAEVHSQDFQEFPDMSAITSEVEERVAYFRGQSSLAMDWAERASSERSRAEFLDIAGEWLKLAEQLVRSLV